MIFRIVITFIVFFAFHPAFSQNPTFDEVQGKWYSSDGSNILKIFVTDEYALFNSQLWDVDGYEEGMLSLSSQLEKVEVNLKKEDEHLVLKFKEEAYPIISTKIVDISDRATASTNLDDDYFQRGQVLLQGVVISEEELPKTISVIYNYAYGDNQKKFVADVDEKGRFKLIYPLENPQTVMIRIGNAFFSYFASPGATQAMVIDESSFQTGNGAEFWFQVRDIDFMGDLAIENEEFRLLRPEFMKVRDYFNNDSSQKALESDDYMDYRLALMDRHRELYQNYFDSLPMSPLIEDFGLRNTRVSAASDLMRYTWLHNMGKQSGSLEPVIVSDKYLAKVKSLVLDEKEELVTEDYAGLNREYAMSMLKQEREAIQEIQIQKVYDFLIDRVSSDSGRVAIEDWRKQVNKKKSMVGIKFTNAEILDLMKNSSAAILSMHYLSSWKFLMQKVNDFGIYQRSSIIATFLDQSFLSHGNDVPSEIQNQLADLDIQPEVLEGIYRQIEEFEALKNFKFVEGIEITATSDNILNQLKEKYQGKVVYVDVWATWCGPCISEFGYMKEIKKEELKDVVFVYLCAQSPEKSYEPMVKKHSLLGDNYFLDNDSYQKFDKEVGISGFPTYMVITKEGKLVREGINRPSSGVALINQLKEFASRE